LQSWILKIGKKKSADFDKRKSIPLPSRFEDSHLKLGSEMDFVSLEGIG